MSGMPASQVGGKRLEKCIDWRSGATGEAERLEPRRISLTLARHNPPLGAPPLAQDP